MHLRKLLIPSLFGGVAMWVIAGIWHNLIMARLYDSVHANHDGIGTLLMAYLILALFISYFYSRLNGHLFSLTAGLRIGVLIGILWVFPHGLAMIGAHGESLSYLLKNTAWHIVEQGLGGVIIAFVYSKTVRSTSSAGSDTVAST